MNNSLYQKFRPKVFNDLLGQKHIRKVLENVILKNRPGHAYIFYGTRGTGKTSVARIFARALNCKSESSSKPCNECNYCIENLNNCELNTIEIDAASNSGVENIRDIKEKMYYGSSDVYEIYIIDEAHMLSNGAFNALLKMLEEPPEKVIFILATTEFQKIPKTVASRCQKFNFKPIKEIEIINFIKQICQSENIEIDENVIFVISELANGSVRDAISLLEELRFSSLENKISENDLLESLGVLDRESIFLMIEFIISGDVYSTLRIVYEKFDFEIDLKILLFDLLRFFKKIFLLKILQCDSEVLYNEKEIEKLRKYSEIDEQKISMIICELSSCISEIRFANVEMMFNATIIRICQMCVKMKACNDVSENICGDVSIEEMKNGNKELSDFSEEDVFALREKFLEKVKSKSKQLFTYLYTAKIEISLDKFIIILKTKSACDRINTLEGRKYLSSLLEGISGKKYHIEVKLEKESKDPLTEIVDLKNEMSDIMTVE